MGIRSSCYKVRRVENNLLQVGVMILRRLNDGSKTCRRFICTDRSILVLGTEGLVYLLIFQSNKGVYPKSRLAEESLVLVALNRYRRN